MSRLDEGSELDGFRIGALIHAGAMARIYEVDYADGRLAPFPMVMKVPLMREGDGPFQPHVSGCFLEVTPERRLVFTTCLGAGWQPLEPWLALTAILEFSPEGTGTRYAARVLHKTAADAAKHAELGFETGWGMVLDQLAAHVQSVPTA